MINIELIAILTAIDYAFFNILLLIFVAIALTIRIYDEGGSITIQWGLKPLLKYYKYKGIRLPSHFN